MAWMGVEFPRRIALGVGCDPGWLVRIVTTASGAEQRNLSWSATKHRYDASLAVRTATDYEEVLAHFHMARAQAHSWPLKDPLDHRCEQAAGIVLLQEGALRLHKRYGSGAFAYDRRITRPASGKVVVYLSGVPADEGTDYTLDYDTGELTFAGADAEDLAWSGQFFVPCRYDIGHLPARAINRRPDGQLLVSVDSIPLCEVREVQE